MRVDSDRNTNGTHVKGSLGTAHHHVLLLLAHGRRKLPDLDSTKDETIKLIENEPRSWVLVAEIGCWVQ